MNVPHLESLLFQICHHCSSVYIQPPLMQPLSNPKTSYCASL